MPRVFEVGKSYEPYQDELNPITILRRTEKTIWVDNTQSKWKMRVRTDADGNEFAIDTSVPKAWLEAFTYQA